MSEAALREFAEMVVALCEPMGPPAYSPITDPIRTILLNAAKKALREPSETRDLFGIRPWFQLVNFDPHYD